MEKYIDCKGYEGIYKVSNYGNVKSLSRYIENGNGGYYSKEKLLKPTENKVNGYLYVSLCGNGNIKKYAIHKLVAISFLNNIPDGTNKIVVDHIDNNKLNNNLSNLQLITNRENTSKISKGNCNSIGVYFYARINRFRARIRVNGKRICLGQFKTELEASNAYQKALLNI